MKNTILLNHGTGKFSLQSIHDPKDQVFNIPKNEAINIQKKLKIPTRTNWLPSSVRCPLRMFGITFEKGLNYIIPK